MPCMHKNIRHVQHMNSYNFQRFCEILPETRNKLMTQGLSFFSFFFKSNKTPGFINILSGTQKLISYKCVLFS